MDRIENQELYHVLITVDRLTLQIVLMKIQGYRQSSFLKNGIRKAGNLSKISCSVVPLVGGWYQMKLSGNYLVNIVNI